MTPKRMPQTDSIEELARLWDAHDLTDFEEELEGVPGPVFEPETVVKVHLSASEAEAVQRMAETKGVTVTELVTQWIRERIQ